MHTSGNLQVEKGFYYHYKHNPSSESYDGVYEVIGTAFNTESGGNVHLDTPDDFLADEVVVYRPLFKESLVYKAEKRFWIRPKRMFGDMVVHNGETVPRFQKIVDPHVLKDLQKIREEMY